MITNKMCVLSLGRGKCLKFGSLCRNFVEIYNSYHLLIYTAIKSCFLWCLVDGDDDLLNLRWKWALGICRLFTIRCKCRWSSYYFKMPFNVINSSTLVFWVGNTKKKIKNLLRFTYSTYEKHKGIFICFSLFL